MSSPHRSSARAIAIAALAAACSSTSTSTATLHVPSPAWEDQIIYFVMTDRFANGDKTNDDQGKSEYDPTNGDKYSGGDLQGVIDHLDYIQGLGATAVWITPPVANMWWDPLQGSGGYHGYWARNLKKVDEHLGTLDTYQKLSVELHRRGMYLIQDVVPNHMGNFFQYTSYDPADVTKGWIRNTNAVPTNKPELAPFDQDDPTDPAQKTAAIYHWTPVISDYNDPNQILNYQISDLDDLNTENPVVRTALRDSYGYWVKEVGVDAFRVDTAIYVPHDFWNDFFWSKDTTSPGINLVAQATGRSKFLSFGEVFVTSDPLDDSADKVAAQYTGTADKPELSSALSFPLYQEIGNVFASGKPTSNLSFRLGKFLDTSLYPNYGLKPTFVDNHDVRRFLSVGSGPALVQALAFIFTIPGIPVVYYGTEQALTETRGSLFKGGYASKGKLADADQYLTTAGLYTRIQALAAARKANPIFAHGKLEVIYDNAGGAGGFGYRITQGSDSTLVLFNTADERVLITGLDTKLPGGTVLEQTYSELGTPLPSVDTAGKVTMLMPARGILIAKSTGKTQTPVAPSATITVDTPIDGKTFSQDLTITGKITGSNKLRMVIDGYLDKGTDATVAGDGSWSLVLPVSSFPVGTQTHALSFYSSDAKVATPSATFTTNVVFTGQVVEVDDPVGDDKGPKGTYFYPKDTSFTHQMDITHLRAEIGATTLNLKITMADFSTIWNPPNKFDHVSFQIFFQLPGKTGATVMPLLQGSVPAGFSWSYQQFSYGWENAIYDSNGATADSYGARLAKAPAIAANGAAKTVIFTYDRNDFGLTTWAGVKIYVTTWDYDGVGNNFRAIVTAGDQWKVGGGQPGDPYVMDDVPPITLVAP